MNIRNLLIIALLFVVTAQASQVGTAGEHSIGPALTTISYPSSEAVNNVLDSSAYGVVIYPDQNLVRIPDLNSSSWDILSTQPGSMYVGGEFINNDFSKLYVISYSWSDLRSIDIATGEVTTIGPISIHSGGWTGMAGAADGTMYLSSTDLSQSYLYTVDLLTGNTTLLGSITNAPCLVSIAITPHNIMYGVDVCLDTLITWNPVDRVGTVLGPLGFNANNSQGLDYDDASRILYLAAYNRDTQAGELRIANLTTGMTTLVGTFPNGDELDAFAIASVNPETPPVFIPIVVRDTGRN